MQCYNVAKLQHVILLKYNACFQLILNRNLATSQCSPVIIIYYIPSAKYLLHVQCC